MKIRLRYAAIGLVGIVLIMSGGYLLWDVVNSPITPTVIFGGGLLLVGSISFFWAIAMLRVFLVDLTPQPLPLSGDIIRIARCSAVVAIIGGGAQLLGATYPTSLIIYLATAGVVLIAEMLSFVWRKPKTR